MFPLRSALSGGLISLPRIRGGVSFTLCAVRRSNKSSPHTRGCFRQFHRVGCRPPVFPAYAGVFLLSQPFRDGQGGLPRIRGGVSSGFVTGHGSVWSSPHTRGCFLFPALRSAGDPVFPAYAGVFPALQGVPCLAHGLPRIRGGVSSVEKSMTIKIESSPHTRGCFSVKRTCWGITRVFPAYAGVFLPRIIQFKEILGLPRIRGGVS